MSGPPTVTGAIDDDSVDAGPLAGPPGASPAHPASPVGAARQRWRLIVVGVILVSAFGFLLVKGLGS